MEKDPRDQNSHTCVLPLGKIHDSWDGNLDGIRDAKVGVGVGCGYGNRARADVETVLGMQEPPRADK